MEMSTDGESPLRGPSPEPEYRNPELPPELQQNAHLLGADTIGNTAFSKHWLFSTLMKLIDEAEKEGESTEESEFGVDVDEELQNELCKLWDMSMTSEVATFLHEFKAIDILTGVIGKSKAPRVTEVCVGILGNMACDSLICKAMSENDKLVNLVLMLLENGDAPTLVETTRLLYTCLADHAARTPWIKAIKASETICTTLQFILQSSTNCELLKHTAQFVNSVLDLEGTLCVSWAMPDLIHSLLEAIQQIGCSHSDALESFMHIFQLISTTEEGVRALVSCCDAVQKPLMKYLSLLCEYEIVDLGERCACVASALSVLNILYSASPTVAKKLTSDEKLIRIFLKILEPLYPQLFEYNSSPVTDKGDSVNDGKCDSVLCESSTPDKGTTMTANAVTSVSGSTAPVTEETNTTSASDKNTTATSASDKNTATTSASDKNTTSASYKNTVATVADHGDDKECRDDIPLVPRDFPVLYSTLQEFLVDITTDYMKDMESESADSKHSPRILPVLTYMDKSVSRTRIVCLILTLKGATAQEQTDLLDFLTEASEKLKTERLSRIISDIQAGRLFIRTDSNPLDDSMII